MALLGPLTGYNMPEYGDGLVEDESGLDNADALGVSVLVARLIAPQIGKSINAGKSMQRAADTLLAKYQTTPHMQMGRHTVRGAGNRWWYGGRPYFYVPPVDGEPYQ